jgi:hypothetical protein
LRIWFDILTPKQVMFFKRAVKLLKDSGHQVLCTSREYREAVELAKMKGLELELVGRHGGAARYDKLRASAERTLLLSERIRQFEPDAAVTFSSPEGSRVAFGLGIRHVGFNDSPHAEAVARLTVPLMDRLLCPWVIPYSAWTRYGISRHKISRYRALDVAAWLKHETALQTKTFGKKILIRLEESKASYIADRGLDSIKMVDSLVNELSSEADISILCRYEDQIAEAEARYGSRATIIKKVVDGIDLVRSVDLFVGSGGTMSAEAALLGVPTVSIAPVRFYVDNYLVRKGLVFRAKDPKALTRTCTRMIQDGKYRSRQIKTAARILSSMEDPTDRMVAAITSA